MALDVHHGPTDRQLPARLDLDVQAPPRHDARIDEIGDAQRVVDRRAARRVERLDRLVRRDAALDERRRRDRRRGPRRAQPLAVRPGDQGTMGGVERDEREVAEAGPDDDAGRVGVGPDVELGRRGRVPGLVRAAHDDRARDALDDARLEADGQRDVRQRPDRDERDRVGGGQVRLDQEFGGGRVCLTERGLGMGSSRGCMLPSRWRTARGIGKSSRNSGPAAPS